MNDDRVPGTPQFGVIDYECPVCGEVIPDEIQPECPNDGTLMDPIDSGE